MQLRVQLRREASSSYKEIVLLRRMSEFDHGIKTRFPDLTIKRLKNGPGFIGREVCATVGQHIPIFDILSLQLSGILSYIYDKG